VGYEEAEDWVIDRMETGYPRYVSLKDPSDSTILTQAPAPKFFYSQTHCGLRGRYTAEIRTRGRKGHVVPVNKNR
jgi:hypothetical protein